MIFPIIFTVPLLSIGIEEGSIVGIEVGIEVGVGVDVGYIIVPSSIVVTSPQPYIIIINVSNI